MISQADDATSQMDGAIVPQTDDQPDPDTTITRIDLAANGSATWEITLRTRLSNDTEVTEYERFQDRFRSNTSRYLDPFADRMSGVVGAANSSSPRTMSVTDFAAETTIQQVPRRWGVVRFRFTWTGFAATEGDAVVAGDIFAGGFFISENDALAIAAPDGYAVESASPTPDETTAEMVEWQGRVDFDDGRPSVRAIPAGGSGDSVAGGRDGGGPDDDRESTDTPPFALLASVALLIVLAGVVYALRTGLVSLGRNDGHDAVAGDTGDDVPGGNGDDGDTSVDSTAVSSADSTTQSELLTDEDRVMRLLDAHGGRMKQSAIVDELGWSKSKASRVLSGMADEATINKLRIGRENIIEASSDGQTDSNEYADDGEQRD